jgi:hypothetical protein
VVQNSPLRRIRSIWEYLSIIGRHVNWFAPMKEDVKEQQFKTDVKQLKKEFG